MPPQRPSRTSPEALEALRARLQATQEAAQRLAEEAASDRPPPMGWDVPRRAADAGDELDALISLLATLRDVLPPELRAQLADLVRALLVFVRAVLDWWIGRLETGAAPAPEGPGDDGIQDIPIS
jgi:hypothetical protein